MLLFIMWETVESIVHALTHSSVDLDLLLEAKQFSGVEGNCHQRESLTILQTNKVSGVTVNTFIKKLSTKQDSFFFSVRIKAKH